MLLASDRVFAGDDVRKHERWSNVGVVRVFIIVILMMECTRPKLLAQPCSQMHVQIRHSLAHLQDVIPTLAGVITYIFYTSQNRGFIL